MSSGAKTTDRNSNVLVSHYETVGGNRARFVSIRVARPLLDVHIASQVRADMIRRAFEIAASAELKNLSGNCGQKPVVRPQHLAVRKPSRSPSTRPEFGKRRGWLVQSAMADRQGADTHMPFSDFVGAFRGNKR